MIIGLLFIFTQKGVIGTIIITFPESINYNKKTRQVQPYTQNKYTTILQTM